MLSGVAFIWPFMTSGVNIALPAVAAEFGVDAVRISLMTNITLLFTAICLLPSGRAVDMFGYRKVLLAGIGIAVISTLSVAAAGSYFVLVAIRALQGVGTALISTAGMVFLTREFTGERRGTAFGLYTAAVYLGLSVGPFLGGSIVRLFGWRWIFYLTTLFAALILYQAWRYLPIRPCDVRRGLKFDLVGSIIYSAGLIMIIYNVDKMGTLSGRVGIAGGVAAIVAFLFYERGAADPLLDVKLFAGNRALLFSCLACLISYSAVFAVTYLMSLYLQYAKGLSPDAAGLVLLAQPLMQAVVSPFSGRASGKFEPSIIASVGMALTAAGLFLLIWLDGMTEIKYVVAVSLLLGFGFALFAAPNNNAIMSSVTEEHYPAVSGIVGTLRLLGQLFSMAVVTTVFSLVMGHSVVRADNIDKFISGVSISFTVMTLLCVLSVVLSVSRGRTLNR